MKINFRLYKIIKTIKKNYILIALISLILLQILQLSFWVIKSDTNPSYDEGWHLSNALFYKNKINNMDLS